MFSLAILTPDGKVVTSVVGRDAGATYTGDETPARGSDMGVLNRLLPLPNNFDRNPPLVTWSESAGTAAATAEV